MSKNTITNTTALVNSGRGEALLTLMPGGIEASERRGQHELVVSSTLPTEMDPGRGAFEALGFKFGALVDRDPLFIHAELPPGWTKAKTDHSMWSKILDDKGRPRVEVFYKAAFYDRSAHMSLALRYKIEGVYQDGTRGEQIETIVMDIATGKTIFTCPGNAYRAVREWLAAHRPEWADPVAGWASAPA